jgi:alkanesulfonate monooxygenase SsuD/methylene tetrahydromethanopterin reductase-like flavin-dependent oxidoreductase (luciferase family)
VASNRPIKIGALLWPQYTDWASLRDTAALADGLGYDSLWTWDHLYPIVGSSNGPIFEGYTTLTGWACVTKKATLGLMVGANTFRNPALTAKIATSLDHVSDGRAVLGIGGAWFGTEHEAFGIDFGEGFGERLDWLDEAVEIMRGMLDGEEPSARGGRYHAKYVRNDPPPIQKRLPILIGGGGEKKTLRTTAKYADMWNIGGDIAKVRHKDEVLRGWCDEFGRDESEIERTLSTGATVLRDDVAEARNVAASLGKRNGGWPGAEHAETVDQMVERLAPYVDMGFRHIYIDMPAPYDRETLERFVGEVKPRLEEAVTATSAR